MNRLSGILVVAGFLISPGVAFAINCIAGPGYVQYSASQVNNLLTGSVACYPATGTVFSNQEAHYSGGILGDYKKGPAGPGVVDPTLTNIGNWGVNLTTGQLTYTYLPSKAYTYFIFGSNFANPGTGTYDFCPSVGATPIQIRVKKASTGPCP